MTDKGPANRRGRLKINAPLDDALRAALKVKPPEKPPRQQRAKRKPKPRD